MLRQTFGILAVLFIVGAALGQDDDEQLPGLRARYRVNQTSIERVDPDIAFDWAGNAPDERLPFGKFTAEWTGTLLLRSEEKYQFHAFTQGRVWLTVNGQKVLEGHSEQPAWISGPEIALSFGDQPFELKFEKTGESAQLKLFWSSGEFPLEPVPYHVLFLRDPAEELALIEKGRRQYESLRCGSCHPLSFGSERLAAPSLKHIGAGTRRDWLIDKLMTGPESPPPATTGHKMPGFGLSREDAVAIVAALTSHAAPADLLRGSPPKESERNKDLQAGRTLIRSIGCLACHSWNSQGEVTDFSGGVLDAVAKRRSGDWITTWLADPGRINPSHRMPVFNLSEKERSQIVQALSAGAATEFPASTGPDPNAETLARGLNLIEKARCANCHEIPWLTSKPSPVKSLADAAVKWSDACGPMADRAKHRPGFRQADMKAIEAWVRYGNHSAAESPTETAVSSVKGRRLLERKNCLNCHDRDDNRGLSRLAASIAKADETLTGLHMTLIPPRLNAVGDRMVDASLAEAIRGEQKAPRLNWLKVRMPKFNHGQVEQAALLRHLIDHDRIPDAAPGKHGLPQQGARNANPDPQQILAGRELLGGKGFSCVACHAVKDYTPKVTALGTRGSNLFLIGQRMRTDYFFRWTRSPLRVMPGVEMPNYQRPHEFILPGQLDQQLVAIWQALNDPALTAPTNPAVVEQLLTVGDNEPVRVVRDVFTVPGTADETVAHSYAFGLPGGQGILVDLDTMNVRGWTLGDFARQRCEGKRWYWDLAGTVLASQFDKPCEIALVDKQTGELIAPETGWNVESRFVLEIRHSRSVALNFDLTFSKGDVKHVLDSNTVLFLATEDSAHSGWTRRLTLKPSSSVWPWLRNSRPGMLHPQATITTSAQGGNPAQGLPASAAPFELDSVSGHAVMTVKYQSPLRWKNLPSAAGPQLVSKPEAITTVPGFSGQRLPLPRSIMPTALAWDRFDRLMFTSLKGHLYRINSLDSPLQVIEEGLAAPFGVIELPSELRTDRESMAIVVAHKPELARLSLNSRGQVENRRVFASGWGVTDDYHDWACGIAHDAQWNLYLGLGSDYTFKNRPVDKSRWRGHILRVSRTGHVESIANGLRYPTGLAIDDQGRLFCSDQQGVQNTFNELNYIQAGHRYGVPSRHEPEPNAPSDPPAVQIPHPWTRSVNGIAVVPHSAAGLAPIAGHLLGCEFNNNLLIRMSLQTVGDSVQGAVYPFSKPAKEGDPSNFLGPLCLGFSPKGDLYVGSLQDGGWAGGLNMGDLIKLSPTDDFPNGIREIRVTPVGFDLEFFHKIDASLAGQIGHYRISGYTRVWKGDYATPDSGNHACDVSEAAVSADRRVVSLTVAGRKTGHVYDIAVGEIGGESQRTLWPAIGHYTLHRIPD